MFRLKVVLLANGRGRTRVRGRLILRGPGMLARLARRTKARVASAMPRALRARRRLRFLPWSG